MISSAQFSGTFLFPVSTAFHMMILELLQEVGRDGYCEKDYLASFLLKGMSGLVYDETFATLPLEIRVQETMDLICRTLQIPYHVFES